MNSFLLKLVIFSHPIWQYLRFGCVYKLIQFPLSCGETWGILTKLAPVISSANDWCVINNNIPTKIYPWSLQVWQIWAWILYRWSKLAQMRCAFFEGRSESVNLCFRAVQRRCEFTVGAFSSSKCQAQTHSSKLPWMLLVYHFTCKSATQNKSSQWFLNSPVWPFPPFSFVPWCQSVTFCPPIIYVA